MVTYGSMETTDNIQDITMNTPSEIRKRRATSSFVAYKDISKQMISSWAQMSYGLSSSFSINMLGTVVSLDDVPSDDRRSSGFLMSISLQSMILGTSLLSIPYCLKVAGVWSLVLTLIIGVVSTFTANILSECQYQESFSRPRLFKRIHTSFVDMSRACWSSAGGILMEALVYFSLARNIVVIILLADISCEILNEFVTDGYNKNILSVFWMFATLPLLFITRISVLAFVSFIGLILYLIAMFVIMILCLIQAKHWGYSNFSTEFDIKGFGIAAGIILNSYAVHMNLPALEASLRKPNQYNMINKLTFFSNTVIKIAFALVGFFTFAQDTQQEITSNIHVYYPLPTIIKSAVMFFAYFTIPLQSFVVFTLIDDTFKPKFTACTNNMIWLLISRSLFMTLCLLIAVLVPNFSVVVSLIGSIRGSFITLILPSLYYITLKTHDKQLYKVVIAVLTAVFGCVLGIIGCYASTAAIINEWPIYFPIIF